jgi:hypothetical protein
VPAGLYVILGFIRRSPAGAWPRWYLPLVVTITMLGANLALPAVRDVLLIKDHSGDSAASVPLANSIVTPISRFLRSHQGAMRYEAAFVASTIAAPFIVRDTRPVLLLTTVNGWPLVTSSQLQRAHAQGLVRYVFDETGCQRVVSTSASCSLAMRWVRRNARDITGLTGLPDKDRGLLYDLGPPA